MTKVALYARYSSDSQSAASIEDQFRLCRERAEREGWKIVGTYHDAAISGASVVLRPGVQALLQGAQRGVFDLVLAEALDRVSRDQADVATLFKHLRFAGVEIVTLAEGEISELHVGLKGTMNALFLKDLAAKTHRGIRGRIEKGKSGGGLCYGYHVVRRTDRAGEPVRGERTINAAEAEIVRRIFREFAAGKSPRAIARRLNNEGIPGPAGALWADTTLRGHAKRGTGIINNELYVGRLVWNRLRYLKDPSTGKRVSRINPPEDRIAVDVPELRIVDDALWQAVKTRQAELAIKYADVIAATRAAHANRLNGTHRPRSLLSGLLICGRCGGPYALRGQDRYACSKHVMNASCANSRTIRREALEERVLAGLRDRLMTPQIAAEAMRAYVEETNRLNRERRASGEADRKALAETRKKIKELVTLIEDGGGTRAMVARLRELEALEDELTERLSRAPADIPDIHPKVAGIYRRKVERLAEALRRPQERDEAAEAIRGVIERITLTPGPRRGQIDATLHGELGTILEWTVHAGRKNKTDTPAPGVSVSVVAGARNTDEAAGFDIRAVVGLAPAITDATADVAGGDTRGLMLIYGSQDNDVEGLGSAASDAFAAYDRAGTEASTTCHAPFCLFTPQLDKRMLFIHGADHAGLVNRSPTCGVGCCGFPFNAYLSSQDQFCIAKGYTNAFLRYHLKGETIYKRMLEDRYRPPSIAAITSTEADAQGNPPGTPLRMMLQQSPPARSVIENFEDGAWSISHQTPMVEVELVTPEALIGPPENVRHVTHLATVSWPQHGTWQLVGFDAPAGRRDVRAFSHVALRIGQLWTGQSTGTENPAGASQSVLIGLWDGSKTSWRWSHQWGDIPANDFRPGGTYTHSVMNTIAVPLTAFSGVNKGNIRAVLLAFPAGSQGTLMLDSLEWFRN